MGLYIWCMSIGEWSNPEDVFGDMLFDPETTTRVTNSPEARELLRAHTRKRWGYEA